MSQEPNYKAELVGVFGHPVAENPTILMQEAAFAALDLNWRYLTIEVYPDDLEKAFIGLKAFNMKGINLTIPHKVKVLQYLDKVTDDAALMGAVNTVRVEDGKLIGENTDGKGFINALVQDSGISPAGKTAVILGAGGAARAIAVELALNGASHITIVNRSMERGQELTALLNSKTAVKADFIQWNRTVKIPVGTELLINATSIGLYPDVNDRPDLDYESITDTMTVCDVIPNPPQTPFLQEAAKRGAGTIDGLGMLVHQGAIGFTMWTGREAPLDVMHKALAEAFGLS